MEAEDRAKLASLRATLTEILAPQGFVQTSRTASRWRRDTASTLRHYVYLEQNYGRYELLCSIVSDPVGEVIYDRHRVDDPAYHVVLARAESVSTRWLFGRHSLGTLSFRPCDTAAGGMSKVEKTFAEYAVRMAKLLEPYDDERALWTYLLQFLDAQGPESGFWMPTRGPGLLLYVAALAAAAGAPEAADFAKEALVYVHPKPRFKFEKHRNQALRSIAESG